MKRVPINERVASKIVAENPTLTGQIVEERTVFYNDSGVPVLELFKSENFVSYYAYMQEYKQEE